MGNSLGGVSLYFNLRSFLAFLLIPTRQSAASANMARASNTNRTALVLASQNTIENISAVNPYNPNIKTPIDNKTIATINQSLSPSSPLHFWKSSLNILCLISFHLVAFFDFTNCSAGQELKYFSKTVKSGLAVAGRNISALTVPGQTAASSPKSKKMKSWFFIILILQDNPLHGHL